MSIRQFPKIIHANKTKSMHNKGFLREHLIFNMEIGKFMGAKSEKFSPTYFPTYYGISFYK